MITQSFREQLSKIVTFIFDNSEVFITKFIIDELTKSGISLDDLSHIDLKNVFISSSLVFIKVEYYTTGNSVEYKDFFLESDEVFEWVNSLNR